VGLLHLSCLPTPLFRTIFIECFPRPYHFIALLWTQLNTQTLRHILSSISNNIMLKYHYLKLNNKWIESIKMSWVEK